MTRSPTPEKFDVFLCHNSEDKAFIRGVAQQLRAQALVPWLDEEQLIPGRDWLDILEQDITKIKTVAVFVGSSGIGPWQRREISAFLREFVERNTPVIPVLLHNAPKEPQLPILLKNLSWVDFRRQEPAPLELLLWGITGRRVCLNQAVASQSMVSHAPAANGQGQAVQQRQTVQDLRYQKLEELLKAQQWKEADQETYRLMITAVGKKAGQYFTREELLNFPCKDLNTIDGLWVKYSRVKGESQSRFGFSVQEQIYVDCDGELNGEENTLEVWIRSGEKFGDRVGWRKEGKWITYDKLTQDASISSPQGIFPVFIFWRFGVSEWDRLGARSLLSQDS